MDEELNYATLHFKSPNIYIRKHDKEKETIYSDIKIKESVLDQTATPEGNEKPNSRCQLVRMMGLCLGILCFLLVIANIALSVYFRAVIAEINTKLSDYSNITSENYLLNVEMINLERQKQELSKDRDRLNWTLEVILQFDNFPVHDYCPEKQGNAKDTYPEQLTEFISNYTKFYYDVYHGYWIGLSKTEMPNQRWMWVDGSKLTTRYWTPRPIGSGGDCVLAMPRSLGFPNIMTNWNTASCQMQNRWICKTKALIK
ncbi:uncharacterized protein LOC124482740 isoform X3 [Hypomesus transpacificus]|uniref:uncharacterized protein LOC124482740 isoform X3 n=1 Tax=Hypomesus transpacificus TaxID=137520 RepID=UPI001F074707|nr:uncharacterized protein LOC124482740 isoform X3 [Hypomesus transpacificus]